jgi:hypothetical protein
VKEIVAYMPTLADPTVVQQLKQMYEERYGEGS